MRLKVVIVEDNPDDAELLVQLLRHAGFELSWRLVDERAGFEQALAEGADVVLADYTMPRFSALAALQIVRASAADIPLLVVTGTVGEEAAVECMRAGAADYLLKDRLARLAPAVEAAVAGRDLRREQRRAAEELQRLKVRLLEENAYLQEEIRLGRGRYEDIVGRSSALMAMLQKVEQVAPTDSTVLVSGETGTGKELVVRAIHERSRRRERALVTVNCATLPANLVESELFGREKGAFTGATTAQAGRFELAHEGTLFLDEVGELPLELQPKLLRVLQEGELERVGSPRTIHVDVRVIAATNRDLAIEVAERRFRQDLYYRLNVFPVRTPPLRERKDDIEPIARAFIDRHARRIGRRGVVLPERTLEALMGYEWPGNVRELHNVIERALIVASGPELVLDGFPEPVAVAVAVAPHARSAVEAPLGPGAGGAATLAERAEGAPAETLEAIERAHILKVLRAVSFRISGEAGAARRLGLEPSTLRSRMKKLGLSRDLG